jgi:hypothetical protein
LWDPHSLLCHRNRGGSVSGLRRPGCAADVKKELHLLPGTRSIVPVYWHFTSLHCMTLVDYQACYSYWCCGYFTQTQRAGPWSVSTGDRRPVPTYWWHNGGTKILKWKLKKDDGCVDWINLAHDREKWQAFVNMVMNIWAP